MTVKAFDNTVIARRPYERHSDWKDLAVAQQVFFKEKPVNEGYISGQLPNIATVDGSPSGNVEILVTDRFTREHITTSRSNPNGTFLIHGLRFDKVYDVTGRDMSGVYKDIIVQNVRPVPVDGGMIVVAGSTGDVNYHHEDFPASWTIYNADGDINASANIAGTVINIDGSTVSAFHPSHFGAIEVTISDSASSKVVSFDSIKKSTRWRLTLVPQHAYVELKGVELFQQKKVIYPSRVDVNFYFTLPEPGLSILDMVRSPGLPSNMYISNSSGVLHRDTPHLDMVFDEPVYVSNTCFSVDPRGSASARVPGVSRLEFFEGEKWVEVSWFIDRRIDTFSNPPAVAIAGHSFLHSYKIENLETIRQKKSNSHMVILKSPMSSGQTYIDFAYLGFNSETGDDNLVTIISKNNNYDNNYIGPHLQPNNDPALRWCSAPSAQVDVPLFVNFSKPTLIDSVSIKQSMDNATTKARLPDGMTILICSSENYAYTDWDTPVLYSINDGAKRTWSRSASDLIKGAGVSQHITGNAATSLPVELMQSSWDKTGTMSFDSVDKPFNGDAMKFTTVYGYVANTSAGGNFGIQNVRNKPLAMSGWIKFNGTHTGTPNELGAPIVSQSNWALSTDGSLWFGVNLNPASPNYLKPVFHRGNRISLSESQPIEAGFRIVGDLAITIGNWHHVAMEFDGEAIRLYLDGIMCANHKTKICWIGDTTASTSPAMIGKSFKNNSIYVGGDFSVADVTIMQIAPWRGSFVVPNSGFDLTSEREELLIPAPASDTKLDTSILKFDTDYSDTGDRPRTWTATAAGVEIDTLRKVSGSGSLRINAMGSYIQTAPGANVLSGGAVEFTVQGWIYVPGSGQATSAYQSAVMLSNSGTTNVTSQFFGVYLAGSSVVAANRFKAVFSQQSGSGTIDGQRNNYELLSNVLFPTDQWVHLAFSYDGKTLRIFQDGVVVASEERPGGWSDNPTAPYTIGGSTAPLYGCISNFDQVEIINGRCIYTDNFVPPVAPVLSFRDRIKYDSPWAHYKLDETVLPVLDSSGNNRNLVESQGTPVFAEAGMIAEPGTSIKVLRTGPTSGDRVLSSSNAYGTDIATAFDGDKAWTLSAVVNFSDWTGAVIHIGNYAVANSQGLWMSTIADGGLNIGAFTTSQWQSVSSDTGVIALNETAIIHVTREIGGTCSVYKNGVLLKTGWMAPTRAAQNTSSGGMRISIGAATTTSASISDPASAKIQDVAVYAKALSAATIRAQAAAAGFA